MTENKGIMLAKSVQKHAGRAKEKILQNLGKVDRTADEIFDDHLNNFNRQQASANRLQKEFNNYIRCVRAIQAASKSLMDAICDIYEPQWTGFDAIQAQSAASDSLWQDFAHKLGDQVLIPLNTYTGQFPEMKKKVEKRNRKLIDYDGQRHSFQNLQANANKRKDDVKLTKGREQLEEARRTYEILNTELHDELPALYDSRILFLVTNLQTLFATEEVFHSESAKIYTELESIVDKLATESQRGSNTLRKQTTANAIKSSSPVQSPVKMLNNSNITNSNYQNQITTNGSSNVNSPTSSSSQPESRLDSISSTPESTPEIQKSLTSRRAAAATPTTPSSTTSASINDSLYPNAAEIAVATITTTPESPATTTNIKSVQDMNQLLSSNANNEKTVEEISKPAEDEALAASENNKIATAHQTLNGNGNSNENGNDAAESQNNNLEEIATEKPATAATPTSNHKANATNGNVENKKALGKESNETENDLGKDNNDTQNENITPEKPKHSKKIINKNPFDDEEQIFDAPKDISTTELPAGVLYRVKATYGYVKEDVDELSFEIGDIIRVIEYDDPEDQEEGWLMGEKEGTNEKGLFPANFTRPI